MITRQAQTPTAPHWVRGTTTYLSDGSAFIAQDAEGFNLYRCSTPWKPGTLVGTFPTAAEAKHAA